MIKKKILILSVLILVAVISLFFWLFFRPWPKEVAKAKVAIVLDDWGYNLRYIDFIKEIDFPVTISILPNLRYSSKIAEEARTQGKEIILHLPLEPERGGRNIRLEPYTIVSDMSEEEIVKTLERALSSVPFAQGVSNHMGSLATKDNRLMSTIFTELKKRDLYFLDNLVIDQSICQKLAKKMHVGFSGRNFFLDNLNKYEYIKGQFEKLSEFALEKGRAVGIAHAKLTSLEVLKEMVPLMQEKGIEFVFVSELIK